jgi:hypothetical protein
MDCITVLAQAVDSSTYATEEAVVPMVSIWEHITDLGFLEALTFISFGSVCLLYGWRVFKVLVAISFALLGLGIGLIVGGKVMGEGNEIWAGLIGLGLLVGVSLPLMRYAVSILGALAGGVMTAGIWYGFGLTENYIWAGALIGTIAGGMISFIVFKIAVMLFSSLGGSVLIVVGMLALLYHYPATQEQVEYVVFKNKWFMPVALIAPTAIGLVLQNRLIKRSKEWEV